MSASCQSTFDDIDPADVRVLSFDFPRNSAPTSATLEVTSDGDDPLPSTRFSSLQVQGDSALVTAHDCQDGNTYHLRVIAPTADPENTMVCAGYLRCVKA